MPNLLKILPNEFADGLTTAEAGLMRAAAAGDPLDLRIGDHVVDRPENAGLWSPARTIRGDFLSWLCRAITYAHERGVSIIGARIEGPVNLDSAEMRMPLKIVNSSLDDVILLDAKISSVNLEGCLCGELVGDGLICAGDVVIDRLKARGEVRFVGANIGALYARSARFDSRSVYAFSADRMEARSGVDLSGSFSSAWVRLLDAKIGGTLLLERLRVHNYGSYSVSLDRAHVAGNFHMRAAELAGEFQMPRMQVGGVLYFSDTWCRNPGDVAIGMPEASVGMDTVLERVSLQGGLDMQDMNIGGMLDISGSELDGTGRDSLTGTGLDVKAGVYVRDTKSHGPFRLAGLTDGGSMYISRSRFEDPAAALDLEGASVAGVFYTDADAAFAGPLVLRDVKAAMLDDHPDSWPEAGLLELDGFEYGRLRGAGVPPDGAERVRWLRLMPKKPFRRGPYVRAARMFHMMGREADMRVVAEAMYEDMKAAGELRLARRVWKWLKQGKGDLGLPGV